MKIEVIKPRSFLTLLKLWCKFQWSPFYVKYGVDCPYPKCYEVKIKAYWLYESAERFARKMRTKHKRDCEIYSNMSYGILLSWDIVKTFRYNGEE
jgi:hypothetical protein